MGDTFKLTAADKDTVVSAVNSESTEFSKEHAKDSFFTRSMRYIDKHVHGEGELYDQVSKLHLDTHEGRKDFLVKKFGIDANTPDNYRLVDYQDETGQHILFKGHMDGETKLVLTESLVVDNVDSPLGLEQFFQSSLKPLPKPIEVQIEKSTPAKDGSVNLELSPTEQKKLETQATFATLLHKADSVELTSNARLPHKQKAVGQNRTV